MSKNKRAAIVDYSDRKIRSCFRMIEWHGFRIILIDTIYDYKVDLNLVTGKKEWIFKIYYSYTDMLNNFNKCVQYYCIVFLFTCILMCTNSWLSIGGCISRYIWKRNRVHSVTNDDISLIARIWAMICVT